MGADWLIPGIARPAEGSLPARTAVFFLVLWLALPQEAHLQERATTPPSPSADSATVVPAAYCAANPLFSALAGSGYRQLWTTPITVPVARLEQLGDGGLTPDRVGGGMTTQTLHLSDSRGLRYVFRSVQKVTRQALSEEFWGTPVEAIVRDQLCSFHPTGAVVVAPLLEAVGVLHPHPRFLVVPDDPNLGEFRDQFAGMLVLFEERPDDLPDGEAGFAGSSDIEQTEDLFDELEDHPGDCVAARELLKGRLVDLLVGDRDRSINNFLWARFDDGDGGHRWRPIPRDRDQAFVRFDGIVKGIGRWYDPRLVTFGAPFSDIGGLTRNAWDIDRNLLVGLDRSAWDSTVVEVMAAITDQVIHDAVRQLPESHYRLVGREIEAGLRSRRDNLPEAAAALYRIVFREADIHGTDEDEVGVLSLTSTGGVRVALHERGDPDDPLPAPHFLRSFSPAETSEIRIYMHGGDDVVRFEGLADSPITIRVVGGGGADSFTGSAEGSSALVYDDGGETEVEGEGVSWIPRDANRPFSWWVDGEGNLDFGSRSWPALGVGYDPDRGAMAILGFKRERFGFLSDPFLSRIHANVGWAFGRSEPEVSLDLQRRHLLGPADLHLTARYSGFEIVRFYGLGNDTRAEEPASYYQVRQRQLAVGLAVSLGDGKGKELRFGPVVRRTASDTTNPVNYVTTRRTYGTGDFRQAGVQATLRIDSRDLFAAPSRGYMLTAGGSFYPSTMDVDDPFGEIHGELSVYASPLSDNSTLAFRVGGKHLWGNFPYSDAAFIGGSHDVRGLREQRYAGEAAIYGSGELRAFLTRFNLLFPTDLGVFGFSDLGRVFVEGQPSGGWHHSVGGGIWVAPVSRSATVQVSIARSEGRNAFYVGSGFAF